MLRVRLLYAALILTPLLMLVWADTALTPHLPAVWLYPLALLIWLLAAAEMRGMVRPVEHMPTMLSALGGTLMVGLASGVRVAWNFWGPYPADCPLGFFGWAMLGLVGALGIAFTVEMRRFRGSEIQAAPRVAWSVFIATYLGTSLTFVLALRLFRDSGWGMAALISLLAIVKLSDTGAYAAGRMFGRHKLAPLLSPKKTLEGAVGGILAAVAAALVFREFVVNWFTGSSAATQAGSIGGWVLYAVLLAVAAIVGDLAESLLKRDLGCKDSSHYLPGLGGLLDVLDSLLFTAPVAYLCWIAGLVGPG